MPFINGLLITFRKGEDDCKEYYVSDEQLKELLNLCRQIKEKCTMEDGVVKNGETLIGGVWIPIPAEGKNIINPEIAHELLPTQKGFFFGGTDYDQNYMDDIEQTIEIIQQALKEDDGEIYYSSSW